MVCLSTKKCLSIMGGGVQWICGMGNTTHVSVGQHAFPITPRIGSPELPFIYPACRQELMAKSSAGHGGGIVFYQCEEGEDLKKGEEVVAYHYRLLVFISEQ